MSGTSPPSWPPRAKAWERWRHWIERWFLARNGHHAVPDWSTLRDRLGYPKTILCLGNGPSSENPSVIGQEFECLFRVNWIWLQRGLLTDPDVVFTADPDLPPAGSKSILGFPTRADANRILRGYLGAAGSVRRSYFVLPELGSVHSSQFWPAFPTNGALMIAAAVELRPDRLIIAGIDLYDHASGKYPDASGEANAYDEIHDRATDIEFIRTALGRFRGEFEILSENLDRALYGR